MDGTLISTCIPDLETSQIQFYTQDIAFFVGGHNLSIVNLADWVIRCSQISKTIYQKCP